MLGHVATTEAATPLTKLIETDGLLAMAINELRVIALSLAPLQNDDEPLTIADLDADQEVPG